MLRGLRLKRTDTFLKTILLSTAVASFLFAIACSNSDTVVKDGVATSSSPTPAGSAQPVPTSSVPVATPTAAQAAPGASPAFPTDGSRPSGGGSLANVIKTPYKPTPTPDDPLPPRPTPTIVMENGQIKQQWQAPPEAKTLVSAVKSDPDAAKKGEYYYNQRCVDCHGRHGFGNGFMSGTFKPKPTNLASRVVQANTDGELFWKITNGKSPMPANRVRFTDEQRWYIVSFLRTFKSQ